MSFMNLALSRPCRALSWTYRNTSYNTNTQYTTLRHQHVWICVDYNVDYTDVLTD